MARRKRRKRKVSTKKTLDKESNLKYSIRRTAKWKYLADKLIEEKHNFSSTAKYNAYIDELYNQEEIDQTNILASFQKFKEKK